MNQPEQLPLSGGEEAFTLTGESKVGASSSIGNQQDGELRENVIHLQGKTSSETLQLSQPDAVTQGDRELERAKKQLQLEKEREDFEQQKRIHALEIREKELTLRKQEQEIEEFIESAQTQRHEQNKQSDHQRRLENRTFWTKVIGSTLLLCTGFVLTLRGDNLGPYLMGTGAWGAGSETVKAFKPGDESLKEKDTDSKQMPDKDQD